MLETLDADAVRRWSRAAADLLAEHSTEIDALNVFPVADSDTGSNTLTTLRGGVDALARTDRPASGAADVLTTLAEGAAAAALGNSGFLLSQVLRGLADAAGAAGTAKCDAGTVAAGLASGARLARAAVVTPVDGTMLSVAEAAAAAAVASAPDGLPAMTTAAVRAADAALIRTTSQLPELAAAGVVDAGGRALLVVLAAFAQVISGTAPTLTPVRLPAHNPHAGARPTDHQHPEHDGFAFEVQYDLDMHTDGTGSTDNTIDELRATLAGLGDSVAVLRLDASRVRVHAHVDDIGAAIEAGLAAGRPSGISVVRFADQIGAPHRGHGSGAEGDDQEEGDVAVLAVAPGAGLAHLFESSGVAGVQVVDGGADDLPTGADIGKVIAGLPTRRIVLLPNASRVAGVAEAAADDARARGRRVSVVPTRSPVQALAAIAVHDPARRFDDNVVAMAEAAAATRHAEITIARAEALTAVGICEPGDILGLIDDEVVDVGRGLLAVAFRLLDRLLGVGAEMITVLLGEAAPRRAGELVEAHVRGRAPFTDVHVYAAGQLDHPLIIGVE